MKRQNIRRINYSVSLFLMTMMVVACNAFAQPDSTSLGKASLEIKTENGMTNVTGVFINGNKAKKNLSYSMLFDKKGKSGTSTSKQSGYFDAKPNEKVSLSTSGINIKPGDHYIIRLKILDGKKLLLETEKNYPDK